MPLDPFFTSAQKDQFHEDCQRRKAVAKAIQFRCNTTLLNKPRRKLALRHAAAAMSPEQTTCHKLAGGKPLITGTQQHKSLTGFKPPKKVWDEPKK